MSITNRNRITSETFQTTYHRNGISGNGFYFSKFVDPDNGSMVAISFGPPSKGYTAVLRISDLMEFFQGQISIKDIQAWRGDHFEADIDQALDRNRQEMLNSIKKWGKNGS